MARTALLIADDHLVVRAGLQQLLSGEAGFEVVGEAKNGAEAVHLAERLRPDLVLMDLRMPEMDGAEATRAIKRQHPDTQVLVLTTYDSDAEILRAIKAGATGYILKDAPRQELIRAIRAAARGQALLAPEVAARLMQRVRAGGGAAERPRD